MMLLCPQCQSSQLKGLEHGQTNPLLEKGIQLFAGTIKSNTILLICRACTHNFKPGESIKGNNTVLPQTEIPAEDADNLILNTIKEKSLLTAIKTYKSLTGVKLAEAKRKVETVAAANGIETKTKTPLGCYIIILLIGLLAFGVISGIVKAFT